MRLRILAVAATAAVLAATSAEAETPKLNLSYQRFQLENGLSVLVHEDHSAPLVSMAIYYHVGSKNEPAGRTGFAHLFEHLMFNGSENYDGDWFKPMQEIGATGINGSTALDRTEYHQTIPSNALDRALWMESDRMGHLLGAIDQARLDKQRGVVQNEKREGDNRPYGRAHYNLFGGLFPEDHPYHHSTIGSSSDLDAASLEDVRSWFRAYYGPNNALLVLSGDITPDRARAAAERYFGDIPAGPTVDAWRSLIPVRQHDTREVQYDNVPAANVGRAWAVPGLISRDSALLDIAARILGRGRNSRLYRELVHDRQVASGVSVGNDSYELAGVFQADVMLKPGQAASVASDALDRAVAGFIAKGPSSDEMARAVQSINAELVRQLESNAAIAATLAQAALYADDPAFMQTYAGWINSATASEVQAAAGRYLSSGSHQVDVLPRQTYGVVRSTVDRKAGMPAAPVAGLPLKFPAVEQATLSNGAHLIVAKRDTIPVVRIAVQFDAGYAADQGGKPGVAAFASAMLDEGTRTRNALQISAEAERLGAFVNSAADLDTTTVSLSALRSELDPSIRLWADVVTNASFPPDAVERLRSQQLASLAQERVSPTAIGSRILPPLLYGQGHPYAIPLSGTGTETSTRAIAREDLVRFRDSWLRPDNAVIFVVGDTSLAEIQPLLESALHEWRAPPVPVPQKHIGEPVRPAHTRIILVDRPGSPQSFILGALVGPRGSAPNAVALAAMNDVFAGSFTSRINMNLREGKHWSYGAGAVVQSARGPSPYFIQAPVQTDHTGDSLRELLRELRELNGARPITQVEMTPVIANAVRKAPTTLQSQGSVLGALMSAERLGRPLDYAASLPRLYEGLALSDLQAAAHELIRPDEILWVIVGDRAAVEPQIAALNIAPIEIFSPDGRPVADEQPGRAAAD